VLTILETIQNANNSPNRQKRFSQSLNPPRINSVRLVGAEKGGHASDVVSLADAAEGGQVREGGIYRQLVADASVVEFNLMGPALPGSPGCPGTNLLTIASSGGEVKAFAPV